jgi:hypothetical protein
LRFLDEAAYDEIHFFGDKTFEVCITGTITISNTIALVLLYSTSSMQCTCVHAQAVAAAVTDRGIIAFKELFSMYKHTQ